MKKGMRLFKRLEIQSPSHNVTSLMTMHSMFDKLSKIDIMTLPEGKPTLVAAYVAAAEENDTKGRRIPSTITISAEAPGGFE